MSLTFSAPLQTSIVPAIAAGDPTPTFTRATAATIIDHEGIVRTCVSGEARFYGARRVHNVITISSENPAVWSKGSGSTATIGATDPLGGSTAWDVFVSAGGIGVYQNISTEYPAGNILLTQSAWIRAVSGTPQIYLDMGGGGYQLITLDTTWRRYSNTNSFSSTGSFVVRTDSPGALPDATIQIWHPQMEVVVGQSNTAPGEYVSVGVLSAPYHGANVDGVRYFATENGNSVASNVVTEATGDAIASDTLKGYLSEGQRTNRCLYSEDFTNAAWVKTNMTVSADSAAAPNGATTADTLTATSGNATMIQDLGIVGSAPKAGGCWLKRKTGSGNIDLTMDGGAGWTTVAVTSSWTRFSLSQTLANEDFGIRIVTSGDEVYIWGGQVETGIAVGYLGTDIPTTTVAVTKNPDYLTFPVASNLNDAIATISADNYWFVSDQGNNIVGGLGCGCYRHGGHVSGLYDAVTDTVGTHAASVGTPAKLAFSFSGIVCHVYMNGLGNTGVFDGTLVNAATMYIGANNYWHDTNALRNVRIWDKVMPISVVGSVIDRSADVYDGDGGQVVKMTGDGVVLPSPGGMLGFIELAGASSVSFFDDDNRSGTPFAIVSGTEKGCFVPIPAALARGLYVALVGEIAVVIE